LRCELPFSGLDFVGRLRRDGYGGGEGSRLWSLLRASLIS
jgi:hypothetical protein